MDFKLDTYNDMAVENFNFVLIDNDELIAQRVLVRIQTFYGEFALDTTRGVPWFQDILKKNPDTSLIETRLRETIEGTEGVAEVKSFSLTYDNSTRELSLSFIAQTDKGKEIELSGVTI